MPKLYFSTVEPGDPVTPLTKPPVTRVQIARFAGASQDYSPLHIDDEFAKSAGYGGVFAHGAIGLGFAVEAISRWLENGRILTVATKFQKLVWPGDILTAKGVVVDVEQDEDSGEHRINVDVWTENQNHDIVMKGQITCLLFEDEKAEKKAKSPWPPVTDHTVENRRTAEPISKPKSARPRPASQSADKPPPKTLSRGSPVEEAKKPAKKASGKKAAKKAAEKKAPAKKAAKKAPAKKAPAKKAASKKAAKKAPAKKAAKKKKKK